MIFGVCDNGNIDDFPCQTPNTCSFRTRSTSCKQNDETWQQAQWNTRKETNRPQVINTWQGATVNWENDGKQRHQQTGQENGEGANPKIWRTHWGVKWQQVKARKERTETALMDSFATNDLAWIKPHLGPSIGLHHCTGCSHSQIDAKAVLQAVGAGCHGHECNCNKLLDHFHPQVVASQKAFLKESWWIPGQLRICAVLKLDASRKHTMATCNNFNIETSKTVWCSASLKRSCQFDICKANSVLRGELDLPRSPLAMRIFRATSQRS